jgi:hypothetical protein
MRTGVILGGLGLLAAVMLLSSGGKSASGGGPSGPPTNEHVTFQMLKPGENTQYYRIGPAVMLLDGKPLDTKNPADLNRFKILSNEINNIWMARRKTLPKDAKQVETDAYSKELYWVPSWLIYTAPGKLVAQDFISGGNGAPVDEYGRKAPGHYGNADNSLWGQTLGGLLKNPLFKAVVVTALIASGPQGAAIYAAYTMWEARGKNVTATNLVLTAGRAAAVSQCGPACGVAFDFGVGVASGKSVDRSAEDALYAEMNPDQQAYFKQGKQVYKKVMS